MSESCTIIALARSAAVYAACWVEKSIDAENQSHAVGRDADRLGDDQHHWQRPAGDARRADPGQDRHQHHTHLLARGQVQSVNLREKQHRDPLEQRRPILIRRCAHRQHESGHISWKAEFGFGNLQREWKCRIRRSR